MYDEHRYDVYRQLIQLDTIILLFFNYTKITCAFNF